MIEDYIQTLLNFAKKNRAPTYKVLSLILGAIVFLVVIPGVFIVLGRIASSYIGIDWPRPLEIVLGVILFCFGLYFVVWSVASQWFVGKGTPAQVAPTKHLIVTGPYKLCRNPMELGAVLYYLGVGSFFEGLTTGLISFLIALILGSYYHKGVEEKELLLRFGEEYRRYKQETPFLIPRIRRN